MNRRRCFKISSLSYGETACPGSVSRVAHICSSGSPQSARTYVPPAYVLAGRFRKRFTQRYSVTTGVSRKTASFFCGHATECSDNIFQNNGLRHSGIIRSTESKPRLERADEAEDRQTAHRNDAASTGRIGLAGAATRAHYRYAPRVSAPAVPPDRHHSSAPQSPAVILRVSAKRSQRRSE
jgi:hypothetical protein